MSKDKNKKDINTMKSIVEKALEEIKIEEQIKRNQVSNARISNSIIRAIGDKNTLISIIKLLAFIRHAIKSHKPTEIKVKLNTKIADGEFMFDVNMQEVRDIINQSEIEIN